MRADESEACGLAGKGNLAQAGCLAVLNVCGVAFALMLVSCGGDSKGEQGEGAGTDVSLWDRHPEGDGPLHPNDAAFNPFGLDVPLATDGDQDVEVGAADLDTHSPDLDGSITDGDGQGPGDVDAETSDDLDGHNPDLDGSDETQAEDTDWEGGDASDAGSPGEIEPWPDIPCCYPTSSPGCGNLAVEECVCDVDPYCCTKDANIPGAWDENCVAEVESLKCGTCQEEVVCGDGACHPTEHCETCPQDCGQCAAICGDGACVAPEICSTCPQDCGVCSGSSCCKAQTTPGCDQPAVQQCVCDQDSFCCLLSWDVNCVGEIMSYKCGFCG